MDSSIRCLLRDSSETQGKGRKKALSSCLHLLFIGRRLQGAPPLGTRLTATE